MRIRGLRRLHYELLAYPERLIEIAQAHIAFYLVPVRFLERCSIFKLCGNPLLSDNRKPDQSRNEDCQKNQRPLGEFALHLSPSRNLSQFPENRVIVVHWHRCHLFSTRRNVSS